MVRPSENFVISDPASVAFLRGLYERAAPGRLDWDFSRPGRVGLPGAGRALRTLRLENAGLAGELRISGPLPGFNYLSLKANRLERLELATLPGLKGFHLQDDSLSALVFGGGLGRFNYEAVVQAPNLARVEVRGRCSFPELYIRASRLSDLGFIKQLPNVAMFSAASDRLTDLGPLAGRRFSDLALTSPSLGDLGPLAGLKQVEELALSGGRITDLRPLAGLGGLRCLSLEAPELTDIGPLAELRDLGALAITSAALTDLSPLAAFRGRVLNDLYLDCPADFSPLAGLEPARLVVNGRYLKGGPP